MDSLCIIKGSYAVHNLSNTFFHYNRIKSGEQPHRFSSKRPGANPCVTLFFYNGCAILNREKGLSQQAACEIGQQERESE